LTITIRKRTLILLAATLILLIVVARLCAAQREREAAAQVTPTPTPTATPAPWWDLRRGDGETRRQGDRETGLLVTPSPSPLVPDVTPSPGLPVTHRVQPGDSLSKIAQQYGTTVEELVELNKDRYPSLVEDPGLIRAGWELVVSPQSVSP